MSGSAPIVGRLRTAALLAAIAIAVCGQASPASAAGVYVALGDSPTAGWGAPPGRGYVDLYFAHLRDPASGGLDQLVNLSSPGATTTTAREPGGQLARAIGAIHEPSDTAVVTVELGEGDLRSEPCWDGMTLGACPFGPNFTAIVDELAAALAADPGSENFQVMEYYNPASRSGTLNEGLYATDLLGSDLRVDCAGSGNALGLNDLIACIAQTRGAVAIDTYPTFDFGGQGLMASWPDVNETGHAYLACLFAHPERAGSANPCEPPPPPPPPPPAAPPPTPGAIPDVTPPVLTISGARSQRFLRRAGIVVGVTTDEDTLVDIKGTVSGRHHKRIARLQPISEFVYAGEPNKFRLGLSRKAVLRLRRAFREGQRLTAKLTIRAEDDAGNHSGVSRKIQLVR